MKAFSNLLLLGNANTVYGKNNIIKIHKDYKVILDINGNNNFIQFKEGSYINNVKIFIRGDNHRIIIGKSIKIKKAEFWIEDYNCEIIIGDNTSIQSAHIAVTEPNKKINIGRDCMLSTDIEIRTGDSHSIFCNQTGKRINYGSDVIIKDHVWIGSNVSVLKGSLIEDNCIIGTRSVVTNRVIQNSIAVGVPAKIIRHNVTWDRERVYENL